MGKLFLCKSIYVSLLLFCSQVLSFAQIPTQTIRGAVLDADTQQPIIGATISLVDSDPLIGTLTDDSGVFRLVDLEVGYYRLEVSCLGYQTLVVPELLLESGNEQVQELSLTKEDYKLSPLVVTAAAYPSAPATFLSSLVMTIEEARRFPATYDDPARLATGYPGVASVNDQANHMAIRGNSPASMTWYLEGVEIVNPSHTSNAGTPNDRLSTNGGGVNILSAQLLGSSALLTSAFPADYGNALSGVMDIRLRKGNSEALEYTAQIGLIGIDLAAEGPLSKRSGASFLLNYRYSTLGILGGLGVDFGGETIGFQDLSFNCAIPTERLGKFTLFGVAGQSSNIFSAPREQSLRKVDKDFTDIEYRSQMGLIGMTHLLPLHKGSWKTTIAYSTLDASRISNSLSENFTSIPLDRDTLVEGKLSLHSAWNRVLSKRTKLQLGLAATMMDYEVYAEGPFSASINGTGMGWLLRPYIQNSWQILPQLELLSGLHYTYFTFNGRAALEPRAALRYTKKRQQWSLAYGWHNKVQPPQLYLLPDVDTDFQHLDLDFTKAQHLVLGYQLLLNNSAKFRTEIYYQRLYNAPVAANSVLNWEEAYLPADQQYVNASEGRNYGIEMSYQQFVTDGYYYMINGSLFESEFKQDNQWLNTRFNSNYLLNFIGGKEFTKFKKGKQRTWGVNLRVSYIGGFWETPVDLQNSEDQGTTVYDLSQSYAVKQPNVFRVDSRIYFRKNRKKASSTFALDLGNMTNSKNLAFRYYDVTQGAVLEKNQLGLLPNLSWRIEF